MQTEHPTRQAFERYLRVLGVPARPPGLEALRELTAAHLMRVPFENLSKLLHRHDATMRLPVMDRFLDGVEHHGFGGTCYSNNSHMGLLLAHLGYDVRLCGADMTNPDVHVVNIVTLAGHEYLVDVGYGAPFAAPLPLDRSEDVIVELGTDRFVLKPRDDAGRHALEMYRENRLRHGYRLQPRARRIEEFAGVIDDSFAAQATFMNALLMVRFRRGGSVGLYNRLLVETDGASVRSSEVSDVDALPGVIERHFGIDLDLARKALAGVTLTRDVFG